MLYSLRRFNESEVAQERMRIIKFYEKYKEKTTKETFGSGKKSYKPLFNQRLAEYLIFYNTQRHHKSLGFLSPIEYLIVYIVLDNWKFLDNLNLWMRD